MYCKTDKRERSRVTVRRNKLPTDMCAQKRSKSTCACIVRLAYLCVFRVTKRLKDVSRVYISNIACRCILRFPLKIIKVKYGIWPAHDNTYNKAYASSKALITCVSVRTDQPSLAAWKNYGSLTTFMTKIKYSDPTLGTYSLILVHHGRKFPLLYFARCWLNCKTRI